LPRARKEQKAEQVELLTEKLKKARVAVLTDYRGLTVSQMQELRGRFRTGDVEYRVVKNTLARRAAEAAGVDARGVGVAIEVDLPAEARLATASAVSTWRRPSARACRWPTTAAPTRWRWPSTR
jgi:ribosomal protein L10